MLHSIIVVSSNPLTENYLSKLTHVNINRYHPDILKLHPDPSIGIKEVKKIIIFLSKKSYQVEIKTVIIYQAQLLTIAAQNALLKTLEEPPKNSRIILLTNHLSRLLPTITSRCQIINTNFSTQTKKAVLSNQKISDHFSSKTSAISYLQEYINNSRSKLPQSAKLIHQLQTSLKFINANVNPKLVLENLMFHYPKD